MGRKVFTSAVVGLGNIGMGYDMAHQGDFVQTHTKAYLRHPGFQLSFGVDPAPPKCADFKRLTQRPAYLSFEEALRDFPSVDAVSVCVPVEARKDLWKPLAGLHPKVVVLEKPLAKSVAEAKRVLSWTKVNRVNLCVNYLRRFDESTSALRVLFEKRKYGRVIGVDIRYNGGFFNNASHYIDLVIALFGMPRSLRHTRLIKEGGDFNVDFVLEYSGFCVHGRSVAVDCPVGELTFWCKSAQIAYRRFGQQIDVLTPQPDQVFRKFNELALRGTIKNRLAYAMEQMVGHVYEVCCGKEKLISDGKSAFETLQICERILQKK